MKRYYKLNSILPKSMMPSPLINQISTHAINVIFTEKQVELYIKKKADSEEITLNSNVIGGNKSQQTILILG
jgi:hypothetical protein